MSTSEYVLEFRGVSKTYRVPSTSLFARGGTFKAVDEVSFAIRRGEVFGLVGESGCGKSTLGRIATNLIGDSEGKTLVDGVDARSLKDLSSHIQIVFQDPLSSLNPKKRIGWILEEPLRIHKVGDRESRARAANAMLEKIGLGSSYRKVFPRELSGGQRQRVSIGAALMLRPSIVVADEPVSALDVSVQAQILNLLSDLRDDFGLSYLFISHNLDVVRYMCDRVAVMFAGRIVELGEAEEVYSSPKHPYTVSLLASLPRLEPREKRLTVGSGGGASAAASGTSPRRGEPRKGEPRGGCAFYSRCPIARGICADLAPALAARGAEGGRLVRCHFSG
jgi:oligopeptide/dipeptide ABC transporter ATP-binding protein